MGKWSVWVKEKKGIRCHSNSYTSIARPREVARELRKKFKKLAWVRKEHTITELVEMCEKERYT